MQTDYVKTALMAGWVLAVALVAYVFDITSLAGWTLVAVLSAAPLAVMVRLWSPPPPTMSESIRNVLR